MRYATNAPDGSTWTKTPIDSATAAGRYTSIAIDANSKAHISYVDVTTYDLKYATNSSGSWATFSLDSAGYINYHTSIVVDHADKIHISYYDSNVDDLKYITNAPGYWSESVVVDSTVAGDNSSIAVDSSNKVFITYRDMTGGFNFLKLATNKSGSWLSHRLNVVDAINYYTSLKIDTTDTLHLSCYLTASGDLRYVRLKVE